MKSIVNSSSIGPSVVPSQNFVMPRRGRDERMKHKSKEEISLDKCPSCDIVKTPRVFHCKECNVCIAVHDHHCPWLGVCIGQRNHAMFYSYCWITKIHCLFTFILGIYIIINTKDYKRLMTDETFTYNLIPQLFLVIYSLLFGVSLSLLTSYHTGLILNNETTQESMRHKYKKWGGNPYDLNVLANVKYFLRRQESLIFEKIKSIKDLNQYDPEKGRVVKFHNQHVLDC